MRQFGADLYVANLVAISLFRELGPLLVSVILAGRTGSAFAAELGTMKVNEEVAALTTMGIDPETMLVLPRIAAAVAVMPGLVILMDVSGLCGMGVVLIILGFPPSAIIAQILSTTGPSDFILGLVKGLVFAAAVAMIGCRAGLTAGNGPARGRRGGDLGGGRRHRGDRSAGWIVRRADLSAGLMRVDTGLTDAGEQRRRARRDCDPGG